MKNGKVYNKILAKRFKELREANNLTQEQLADKLDCSKMKIYYIEACKRGINKHTAKDVAELFNIDMNYLLDEKTAFKTSLDEFNSALKQSAYENSLMNTAIINLAKLNGFEITINDIYKGDGNLKSTFENMRKFMTFNKDGEEVLSLSLEEVNQFGNNLSDIFISNIEMITVIKSKYAHKPKD